MEEWSFDVYYWPQKSSATDICAKRIYYSNSLFSRHEILHWIEQTRLLVTNLRKVQMHQSLSNSIQSMLGSELCV